MNLTEYRNQVALGASFMEEIVAKTDIDTYGQFFQVWYNHLWKQLEAMQAGEEDPLLPGEPELKVAWDRFSESWDAAMFAVDENEDYLESFIVDVFYQLKNKEQSSNSDVCKCNKWKGDQEIAKAYGIERTYDLIDACHDHSSIYECKNCGQPFLWTWHEASWYLGEEVTIRAYKITNDQKKYFVSLTEDRNLRDHEIEGLIHAKLTEDIHGRNS